MSHIVEITDSAEEESLIANNEKCVIFFGSQQCPHCRDIVPIYQELSNTYPSIGFAHVETSQVEVSNLDGVPVFVGYRNQECIDIALGASKKYLLNLIQSL